MDTITIIILATILVMLLALLIKLSNQLNESKRKYSVLENEKSTLTERLANTAMKISDLEKHQTKSIELNDSLILQTVEARSNNSVLESEKSTLTERLANTVLKISELEKYQTKWIDLNETMILKTTEIKHLKTQKEELERIQKGLKTEFENIANKILEENSKKFATSNKDSIDIMLKPLGESISEFKTQIKSNLTEETKQRATLQQEVKNLVEQTTNVTQQAENLASALKGKSKTRGDWGEMVLESVLQQAGMSDGREYTKQLNVKDDEDKRNYRPDIVINLPDNRKIVVDSKVSLVDYETYSSTEQTDYQDEALKNHIKSVKGHIDSLSSKEYNKKVNYSADFTMMFIPIEPAYMAALQNDGALWEYAYKRKIMLVGPSNLLPCLKLINDLWNKERITQNANKIVKQGESIYDQIRLIIEAFDKVEADFNKAQNSFSLAKQRLVGGRGNLQSKAETLCKLGINPTKRIPEADEQSSTDLL